MYNTGHYALYIKRWILPRPSLTFDPIFKAASLTQETFQQLTVGQILHQIKQNIWLNLSTATW